MRVIVDQDKCIASGQCVLAAAGVVDQRDEDGIVVHQIVIGGAGAAGFTVNSEWIPHSGFITSVVAA
jgi:ferredoxin